MISKESINEGPTTTGYRITAGCASEMIGMFRTHSALYRALNTNAVTWKQATQGDGARESTVKAIVMFYIQKLRDLKTSDYRYDGKDIFPLIAEQNYLRHASAVQSANWAAFIEPCELQKSAAAKPALRRALRS